MYQNEGFRQVTELQPGALVMKLPGVDFLTEFQRGTAHVNAANNVGYVALHTSDFSVRRTSDADSMLGGLAAMLADMVETPELREQMLAVLRARPMHLFHSQSDSGGNILTMPGFGQKDNIDDEHIEGFVIGTYMMEGEVPLIEQTHAFHSRVVGRRTLVADRMLLEQKARELVPTANGAYEQILRVVEQMGL